MCLFSRTTLGLLALLLVAGPAYADVIVLDAAGGGDATMLQQAIDMAQDGDLVLVRPGVYAGPQGIGMIIDRDLTIVGDIGAPSRLVSLHVVGLSPGKTVVLRGLDLIDDFGLNGPALAVDASAGVVFVEDCVIRGEAAPTDFANSGVSGSPAVVLTDALKVSFQRCTLTGGRGADFTGLAGDVDRASAGGSGLLAERSTVAAYDSDIEGGEGGNSPVVNPPGGGGGGTGTEGVGGIECVLDFVGSTVVGGSGGDGCLVGQEGLCVGGPAVNLDAASVLRTLDSLLLSGAGGVVNGGGTAPPGVAVIGQGALQNFSGSAVGQVIDGPKRSGEGGLLTISGEPGSVFALFLSLSAEHLPLPGQGVFFLPLGPQLLGPFVIAGLGGGGTFNALFTTPSLAGAGLQDLRVIVQTMVQDNAGRILFSSGTALLILDPAF